MLPACDIIFMCPVLTNKSFRQQRCRSQDRVGSRLGQGWEGQMKTWYIFLSNGMHLMYFTHLKKNKKTNEIKIFFIILFFLIYCNPFFCTDELCFEGACRKKWMKCGLLLSVLAWSHHHSLNSHQHMGVGPSARFSFVKLLILHWCLRGWNPERTSLRPFESTTAG